MSVGRPTISAGTSLNPTRCSPSTSPTSLGTTPHKSSCCFHCVERRRSRLPGGRGRHVVGVDAVPFIDRLLAEYGEEDLRGGLAPGAPRLRVAQPESGAANGAAQLGKNEETYEAAPSCSACKPTSSGTYPRPVWARQFRLSIAGDSSRSIGRPRPIRRQPRAAHRAGGKRSSSRRVRAALATTRRRSGGAQTSRIYVRYQAAHPREPLGD